MVDFGLTEKQVKVLEYIRKKGKRSIYKIALDLNMSFSGVYYIIKKLEKIGVLREDYSKPINQNSINKFTGKE